MQETVLKKVSWNISHLCTCLQICYTQYATHSRDNTLFLSSFFLKHFFLFTMWISEILPSWFIVLHILFPYQSISAVTKVHWIKASEVQHTVIENKSCCHCVARVRKLLSSAYQPSLSITWFNFYWSRCMMSQ